jgi:hypothetical protein
MKKLLILIIGVFIMTPLISFADSDLGYKLSGKILLQVEDNGEAWYVEPDTKERVFLGRPDDAFRIMRELGLGISELNYNTFEGKAPVRLSGKILLRVEANGEAYYVNPVDLKMHFLGRPEDAFNVMRIQGLGVSNRDINLIKISNAFNLQEKEEQDVNSIKKENAELVGTTTDKEILNRQYCMDIYAEFNSFKNDYLSIQQQSLDIIGSFVDIMSAVDKSFNYQYDRTLSKKDSFYDKLNQASLAVDELPNISFNVEKVANIKKNFRDGINNFKEAYNLYLLGTKIMAENPISIQTVDNAESAVNESAEKRKIAMINFQDAFNKYQNIENYYNNLYSSNDCK